MASGAALVPEHLDFELGSALQFDLLLFAEGFGGGSRAGASDCAGIVSLLRTCLLCRNEIFHHRFAHQLRTPKGSGSEILCGRCAQDDSLKTLKKNQARDRLTPCLYA